jgi:DNA-binding NtrC family response regulator
MKSTQFIPPSQRRLVLLATQADAAPVLIYGASGTGKGAMARWIHQESPRSASPFVIATRNKKLSDQILQAETGTLYLPEIGSWPLSEQKILYQFIDTHLLHSASERNQMFNVRIMATTSQSLEGRAQGGLFNVQLLEKLNVFRLEMPALCERTDEFEKIVYGILTEITGELRQEQPSSLSPNAFKKLKNYDWPGNLRELRNVLKITILKSKSSEIELIDLPDFGHERLDFHATREAFEKVYIIELLKTYDWKIDEACQITRMNKETLLKKIQQYGISRSTVSAP